MSETVHGDNSKPPTVVSGFSSFEVESPEIYETSSATTTDGVLVFPPFWRPWLISGSDIEFNQNHSNADSLTDDGDDLPSLPDTLGWKWKRNPEVIDLTAEGDVVGTLNKPKFQDLTSRRT